jgi:D-alanyl-D-alanine carboxypeptidase
VLDLAPPFAPGQGFAYADTNYILLGMVIEQVSGGTYEAALRRRILEPVALRDTVPSDRRSLPGLAAGYAQLPAFFRMPPKVAEGGRYSFNPQLEWTGGGLAGTASDLARWAKALFEGKVISPASVAVMTRAEGPKTDFPDGARYGLGCILWHSDFGPSYGHSGFAPGYNAIVEYLPGRRMAFALQCNADTGLRREGASPHQALTRFIRIALAQVP